MTESLNWDEFRIIKAIADTQSLGGAAEKLGLNHSTMFRRLTALETRLGVRLFERERSGYRPTAPGEDMVALATLMGHTIEEFERRVSSDDLKLSGHVRLTTIETIGSVALPQIIAKFRNVYPDLHLEMVFTEVMLDLFHHEADVALRAALRPPANGLTGRRIADLRWGVYAASSLIPVGEDHRLATVPWVTPLENYAPPQARPWFDRNVQPWRRVITVGGQAAIAELAAQGVGAALLPCFVAASKPGLRRIGEHVSALEHGLWLAASPDALRAPRVRALFDFLGDELESLRNIFEGRQAEP